ncbi:tail fiber domain-containing protein [Asaia sp. HN010]|uniref:tail fiber domain-containing protein n=1 Tax=Asaia sp. HN010 TaxID=3081233 RepID=UPI00301932FB
MPYDANGNYILPSEYYATPGTTILTTQHNGPFEDVQAALNKVAMRDGSAPITNLRVPSVTDWGSNQAVGAKDADARYVKTVSVTDDGTNTRANFLAVNNGTGLPFVTDGKNVTHVLATRDYVGVALNGYATNDSLSAATKNNVSTVSVTDDGTNTRVNFLAVNNGTGLPFVTDAKGIAHSIASTDYAFPRAGGRVTGNLFVSSDLKINANASIANSLSIGNGNGENSFTGNVNSGYNPISSFVDGFYYQGGGAYLYSGGNIPLYIGTGNNNGAIISFYTQGSGSSAIGGIICRGSTVQYVTTSDHRLKENVAVLDHEVALNAVRLLRPVSYNWKLDGREQAGFIAHELAEAIPTAVYGEKDAMGDDGGIVPQQIDISEIIPYLVAVVQALTAEVSTLKEKIFSTENRPSGAI